MYKNDGHIEKIEKIPSKEQLAFLQHEKRTKTKITAIQIGVLIAFFLAWEIAADTKMIDPFIFSQPSRMVSACIELMANGSLFRHIGTTFSETVIGFVLGTIIGTATAVVLWWSPLLSKISEPYLVVLNALPKTALAPIIIVWIGNSPNAIIAVALLTSTVVTIMNVLSGFLQVDDEKIKLIQIFGGTKGQILRKVILPANIACILNALKINVGLSFVGVIVGEFLVAQSGLGYLIIYGSQVFKLDWVMLSVILLGVMAAVMYQCIAFVEKLYLSRNRH
ncbi:MAG: ABC transporter permease [Bacillota bacterium]